MLTMAPPSSCSCMTRLAAWDTCSGARRLRATIEVEKRGEAVAASADGEPPALLTTTSSRPKRSTTAATTAATWSGSRTSPSRKTASRPSTAGSSSGRWRQTTATLAPAARKRAAMPRPTPRHPPVTSTVRLANGRSPTAGEGSVRPMRVVVDYDLCESNAICMAVAPEVFEVRDDDNLYVLDENPPESMRAKVQE